MSEEIKAEIAARVKQGEVDNDLEDLKNINRRMGRENAIQESRDRLNRMFDTATQLMMNERSDRVSVPLEYDGKRYTLDVIEYFKDKPKEGGSWDADHARFVVRELDSYGVKYEATLHRRQGADDLMASYLDHKYVKGLGGTVDDYYSWRKSAKKDDFGHLSHFDAEEALKAVPELKIIDAILQKALEVKNSKVVGDKKIA